MASEVFRHGVNHPLSRGPLNLALLYDILYRGLSGPEEMVGGTNQPIDDTSQDKYKRNGAVRRNCMFTGPLYTHCKERMEREEHARLQERGTRAQHLQYE